MSAPVVVFIVCVVACAIAHGAILVSSISARPVERSGSTVPKPRPVVEFLWALIPIVALAFLLTATWNRITDNERHPAATMKLAR